MEISHVFLDHPYPSTLFCLISIILVSGSYFSLIESMPFLISSKLYVLTLIDSHYPYGLYFYLRRNLIVRNNSDALNVPLQELPQFPSQHRMDENNGLHVGKHGP